MAEHDAELKFESHTAKFIQDEWLNICLEGDVYWLHEAQTNHNLCVSQSISELINQVYLFVENLGSDNQSFDLQFGLLRRIEMLESAFREITTIIPPDRMASLNSDESSDTMRAINDIYIQISGMLDNVARGVGCIFGGDEFKKLSPMNVGLFSKNDKKYSKIPSLTPFCDLVADEENWYKNLKEKRDPVVHNIPLYIPPAILTEKEELERMSIIHDLEAAFCERRSLTSNESASVCLEKCNKEISILQARLKKIGSLFPSIGNFTKGDLTNLYPTVSEDIGNAVSIVRRCLGLAQEKLDAK